MACFQEPCRDVFTWDEHDSHSQSDWQGPLLNSHTVRHQHGIVVKQLAM
jgi:hypothetical protein